MVLRLLLVRRNEAKRQAAAAILSIEATSASMAQVDEKIAHELAFEDLTDKENPDFRYVI